MVRDAQPVRAEDLDPPRYVIVSTRVSPMVELARWLFERHRITYEEEGHAPLLHVPFTLWRHGGVEVPVVVSAAATWKGARETLHGLDSRLRAGECLFGDDPAERERNIALVEQCDRLPEPPTEWSMYQNPLAINHIAITYPDRESWLEQVQFLKEQGVKMNLRVNHGMTHSVYINDPNGYGVEVLYELPEEVWAPDIDGALNYAELLPEEDLLVDDTDYETNFSRQP